MVDEFSGSASRSFDSVTVAPLGLLHRLGVVGDWAQNKSMGRRQNCVDYSSREIDPVRGPVRLRQTVQRAASAGAPVFLRMANGITRTNCIRKAPVGSR